MHEHTVRVTTAAGTVEGFTRDGVHRWRSIPYARRRWLRCAFGRRSRRSRGGVCGIATASPSARRRSGATRSSGVGKYQPMGEDCLTLNVVAPQAAEGESLPVMVFIHGGGYILGSSATPIYDGVGLARRGCVYVSVNYRLGALGCLDLSALSTADITLESNLFLRDLVLALRWIQENIAVFGGDPDNVTIFGESAGAHAVGTLLGVPAGARSVRPSHFGKPSLRYGAFARNRRRVRRTVREHLGCPQAGCRQCAEAGLSRPVGGGTESPDRRGRARHAGRVSDRPGVR